MWLELKVRSVGNIAFPVNWRSLFFWVILQLPSILFLCFWTFALAAVVSVATSSSATHRAEMEVSCLQTQPGICGWSLALLVCLCLLLSTDPSSGDHDLTGFSRLAEELPWVLKTIHLCLSKSDICLPTELNGGEVGE